MNPRDPEKMKEVHLIISGKVQGVFFRASVQNEAEYLNLKGLVGNVDSGNVEVVAQGNEASLKKLIEFCKQGPKHASVNKVKINWRKLSKKYSSFSIH